ncbi:MAG: site-specific integrase [Ignavibacteria bacterium]|nr:site-specific integrase [Ignavibacteria bacterium]
MFIFKRKGIYYLEYFNEVENRNKRISTKTRKKPDALKFLTEFKKELNSRTRLEYISLAQFRDEYVRYLEQAHTSSYLADVKTSFAVLINNVGNIPLAKLNNRTLEKMLLELFINSKYSAQHHYKNLRAGFNKAISWNYITENPLNNFKLPKIPKSFPAFINNNELNMIVQNTKSRDLQDIFLTAFHSAMRVGEIINLKWSAINLNERTIIVENSETFITKSKKERMIPINDTLATVLNNRIPKVLNINLDEYVFCKYPGVPYLKDYVSKNFKRVVRKLKMNDRIHLHSLRHSAASNMVINNVSLYTVKEILGVADYSTVQIYAHLNRETLISAVKTLDTQAVAY